MVSKDDLCRKIEKSFPGMGTCGVDFDIDFDERSKAWSVEFHRGRQHLQFLVGTGEAALPSWEEGNSLPMKKARLLRFFHELQTEH